MNSEPKNFADLVQSRMKKPDALFLRGDDGRDFSYASYWELTGRAANLLATQNVKRGGRVMLQAEKSAEALAVFLACARLGAIFIPLNTAYTASEVSYFLEDAEPVVVICDPRKVPSDKNGFAVFTLDGNGQGSFADALQRQPAEFENADMDWDDGVAILYTSGTTGKSKGALLTHGNLGSNAVALAEAWQFTADDVLLHALPIYHTHGLFVATNTVLVSGGSLLFRRKFDVDDIIALLPEATAMMGIPTFYTRLLAHKGLTRELMRHMRLFISGSAPLLMETHAEFEARFGHAILERYGMTETNMNTSNPYGGARKAGTVGMPLPGVEMRITDPATGSGLPQGEVGMIEVRGPNVFKHYWRNPEKTAAEFRADGFFITGDLGSFDAGGYLTISGRGKDLIITGGFNVYPKEVETEIDLLPGVLESAVIGVPHPDFGEGVTAVVVLKEGSEKLDEAAMIAELQERLAKFKVPKRIIAAAELPRNAMGKVQKSQLRETYREFYKA